MPILSDMSVVLFGLVRKEAVGRGHANVAWTRRVVGSPSAPSEAGHGVDYINVPIAERQRTISFRPITPTFDRDQKP